MQTHNILMEEQGGKDIQLLLVYDLGTGGGGE
jgi:hypothetical protein